MKRITKPVVRLIKKMGATGYWLVRGEYFPKMNFEHWVEVGDQWLINLKTGDLKPAM